MTFKTLPSSTTSTTSATTINSSFMLGLASSSTASKAPLTKSDVISIIDEVLDLLDE
eukprot:CAMPEP_0117040872 /NCGR_PEP_ID=MMETSP0472-20121206/28578_1 /TAXON_ID=693140 ORGANISM="Tiarina fusus, Strain LIS" /NCGR_SAMPLE_ID=MMETSP0472 /ASSEMBLY_ACC=CAM_ASM_000603 /LENGTH=56 /DNA_ID=CAMNT_0004751727 /DNA_START=47 /DNA_END=217 /DNA_ORIENTATION=-